MAELIRLYDKNNSQSTLDEIVKALEKELLNSSLYHPSVAI